MRLVVSDVSGKGLMGFCCAQRPLTEVPICTSATVPGQHSSLGARSCLKINTPIPVTRTCSSFTSVRNKAEQQKENADWPQTINQSSHRCRLFFRLLENGWLWLCRVRMSGLCHYNAGSRPSGWQGKSLTGVRFKLTPRQRRSPKGGG